MAVPASEKYMALVGTVALLTAGLLLLARIFKLGFLADLLSRTVLVGFLTGVGFQVGIAMLGDMLGVEIHSRRTLAQAWEILQGLPRVSRPTLALSTLVAGGIRNRRSASKNRHQRRPRIGGVVRDDEKSPITKGWPVI